MTSTSITSALDRMADQAIRTIYKWFTKNVIRPRELSVPDAITVKDLIEKLKEFPEDYQIGFQQGDQIDSEILRLETVESDPMWGIVDFVFKETNE